MKRRSKPGYRKKRRREPLTDSQETDVPPAKNPIAALLRSVSIRISEEGDSIKNESGDDVRRGRHVRRITLDLPEKSAGHLEYLLSETGSSSLAEVIRDALKLYYGLVLEDKSGKELVVKESDDSESVIRIFIG